jgi:hypothetical protein
MAKGLARISKRVRPFVFPPWGAYCFGALGVMMTPTAASAVTAT